LLNPGWLSSPTILQNKILEIYPFLFAKNHSSLPQATAESYMHDIRSGCLWQ